MQVALSLYAEGLLFVTTHLNFRTSKFSTIQILQNPKFTTSKAKITKK